MFSFRELKDAKDEIQRQMDNVKYAYQHDKIGKNEYDRIYLPLLDRYKDIEGMIKTEEKRLDRVKESKKKAKGW